jgi:hypothetical protein
VGGNGRKFLRQRGQLEFARHLKVFFDLLILGAQLARALLHLILEMRIKREEVGLKQCCAQLQRDRFVRRPDWKSAK